MGPSGRFTHVVIILDIDIVMSPSGRFNHRLLYWTV